MIKVHASDGSTSTFDLSTDDGQRSFHERTGDAAWLASVTAVTIVRDGVAHTLARPPGAPVTALEADHTERGERARLFAGGLALSMMAHARHRAARFAVEVVGRHVFRSR